MTEAQLKNMAKAGNVLAGQALRKYRTAKQPKITIGKPHNAIPAKRKSSGSASGLEMSFAMQVRHAGIPEPLWGSDELMFHPDRRWRFDFAWLELKIA
nr:hypothetical protein [Vibrio anguillarum]